MSYPSLHGMLARGAAEARWPQLWRGLVSAWAPVQAHRNQSRLVDYGPSQNHGGYTNGALMGAGRAGMGLVLDGVNDYVIGGNAGTNFPVGASARTVAMWIRSSWSGADLGLIHWGTNGTLPTVAAGANIHLVGSSSGTILWGNGFGHGLTTGLVAVNDNKWHHIVGTYDGASGVIWIDGKRTQSNTWTAATLTGDNWRLGAFQSNAGFWPGTMCDVLLYNRVLRAEEIRVLAGGGNPFERPRRALGASLSRRGYTFASIAT